MLLDKGLCDRFFPGTVLDRLHHHHQEYIEHECEANFPERSVTDPGDIYWLPMAGSSALDPIQGGRGSRGKYQKWASLWEGHGSGSYLLYGSGGWVGRRQP